MITTEINDSERWDDILSAAALVDDAYAEFVIRSDALSELLPYVEDHVLRMVSPGKTASERRNPTGALQWLKSKESEIRSDLDELVKKREAKRSRELLLEKLNLTPEQQALLGIKP